jgi:sarcosine oxidase subunit delta
MLILKCPVCGVEGEETDFHYGHEAHIARPATSDPENISDAQQADYLFMRRNPKGLHFERWRCDRGCGKWFHAGRDTTTMEFKAYYGITELPPEELMRAATGEWAVFFADMLAARGS